MVMVVSEVNVLQVRSTHANSAEADQLLSFLPNGPVTKVLSADIQKVMLQFLEVSGNETAAVLLFCMFVTIIFNKHVYRRI